MKQRLPRLRHSRHPTSKLKTMDLILIIIAVFLLTFTITMIWIFLAYGQIPDTLVTSVFLITGGECGAMAWIKTSKQRIQERKNELEDRAYYEKQNARSDQKGCNNSPQIPYQQESDTNE